MDHHGMCICKKKHNIDLHTQKVYGRNITKLQFPPNPNYMLAKCVHLLQLLRVNSEHAKSEQTKHHQTETSQSIYWIAWPNLFPMTGWRTFWGTQLRSSPPCYQFVHQPPGNMVWLSMTPWRRKTCKISRTSTKEVITSCRTYQDTNPQTM